MKALKENEIDRDDIETEEAPTHPLKAQPALAGDVKDAAKQSGMTLLRATDQALRVWMVVNRHAPPAIRSDTAKLISWLDATLGAQPPILRALAALMDADEDVAAYLKAILRKEGYM